MRLPQTLTARRFMVSGAIVHGHCRHEVLDVPMGVLLCALP